MYVVWIVVSAALIAAAAPLTWDRGANARGKALARYARGMNIAITPEVEDVVIERLVRRERAITVGGLTGIVAAVVVTFFLPERFESPIVSLLVLGATFTGIGIGASIASVTASLTTDDGRPRIARVSTPEYRDYVAGVERWGARVTVVIAILGVIGAFVARASGALGDTTFTDGAFLASGIPAIAAASVLAIAVVEIVARRVSAHSQRASSPTELAWDDALRATALRDLVTVPLMLSGAAVFGAFFFVGAKVDLETGGAIAGFTGLALLGVLLAVAIALTIWNFTSKPQQHYWRRLWAPTAAGAGVAA